MKKQRFLAAFLAVAMLAGAFTFLAPAAAAATATTDEALDPFANAEQATELAINDRFYESSEAFVNEFMQLRVSSGAYQLYANPHTGEVALKNRVTGQILTTNPHSFGEKSADGSGGNSGISDEVKAELLSQIIIKYKMADQTNDQYMNSYTEAAKRGQIYIRDIKNGVRVEYILGRLDSTYLLPGYIMADRFESEILTPIRDKMIELLNKFGAEPYDPESGETQDEYFTRMTDEYSDKQYDNGAYGDAYFAYMQFAEEGACYTLLDPNSNISPAALKDMQTDFPITAQKGEDGKFYAIYTLDKSLRDNTKARLEGHIKRYCTEYGYDDLEADHAATLYEADSEATALFRLALEYILDEDGMTVRLPAGGIRYDETLLTLYNITINPYFGAGDMNNNDGYVFFPDGTGSILEFEDLYNEHVKTSNAPAGLVYGEDYAYYDVSGSQHQESVRMPVYGLVDAKWTEDANGVRTRAPKGGFLAILTEGDALTEIAAEFGATTHNFASIFARVTPRPTDEYSLENAISATGSGDEKWTVVSDRKYTGNYTTKIVMLTDSELGDQAILDEKMDKYYRADWIGMAQAYRDFLEESGAIDRLTAEETKDQLPLYIESFGSIETVEKIMSMPITVDVALTSFEDIQKMYDDLSKEGITNINFRLVGFANGGMDSRYPVKLKWEKAVGGSDGFEALLKDAEEKGYGVYPDFNFLYITETGMFDGISVKGAAVRTVDDRYASRQIYDAVYQDFFSYYEICVASSQIGDFYDTFAEKYGEYGAKGLSLALFGENLNSNFDEDDPTNRADAKKHYISVLKKAAEDYTLMSEGGNVFSATYVDHMLNAPIESSNYSYSSHTVPFYGMVLHGYINMAGSAFNEAGDVTYNIMHSIENGLAPYYILSYDSDATALLKQDPSLSEYYSIRYDIWFSEGDETTDKDTVTPGHEKFLPGELLNQYRLLNAAIGDLQTALITDYQFLIVERVRKQSEIDGDIEKLIASIIDAVGASANVLETIQIRQFRRELDIFTRMNEIAEGVLSSGTNVPPSLLRLRLLNEMKTYIKNEEYKKDSIYAEEDVTAALKRFALATYNTIYNVEGEKIADLPIDGVIGASISNTTALESAYRALMKEILPPVAEGETAPSYDSDLTQLRNHADKYVDGIVEDYVTRYIAGERFGAGKTVAVVVDVESVTAMLLPLVKSALTEDELKAVVTEAASIYEQSNPDTDLATVTVKSAELTYSSPTTESCSTEHEDDYVFTNYSLDDGRCVMVTYTRDSGEDARFALNYNLFDVEVRYFAEEDITVSYFDEDGVETKETFKAGEVATIVVPSYGFVRID